MLNVQHPHKVDVVFESRKSSAALFFGKIKDPSREKEIRVRNGIRISFHIMNIYAVDMRR